MYTQIPWDPEAERALDRANAKARYYNRTLVGTEHLLCSLLSDENCTAVQALRRLNLLESVRIKLDNLLPCGQGDTQHPQEQEMELSNFVRSVIDRANAHGASRKEPRVYTDDLLVALLQDEVCQRLLADVTIPSLEQALCDIGKPFVRRPAISVQSMTIGGKPPLLPR